MPDDHIDRVLLLLMFGMILSGAALFACEIWFKDDGEIFTVFSALMAGFSGSFFTRLKPKDTPPSLPISDSAKVDVSATLHQEPPKPANP